MHFEWDQHKARSNEKKHHVTFQEATTILGDPLALTFSDPDHSLQEERFLTFGYSQHGRLLVVGYTYRRNFIRIITARLATRAERTIYEEG